jgi:hypothetical protein
MIDEVKRVRQNYLAISLAAVACFLFEAAWYSYFLKAWLEGIGRTGEWLMATGVNPVLQYATALISAAVMAAAISCVTQLTGPQTALQRHEDRCPVVAGIHCNLVGHRVRLRGAHLQDIRDQHRFLADRNGADGSDCRGVEEEIRSRLKKAR